MVEGEKFSARCFVNNLGYDCKDLSNTINVT